MMHKPSKADVLKVAGEPVAALRVFMTTHDMGQSLTPNPPFKVEIASAKACAKSLAVGDYPLYTESKLLATYAAGAEWKEAVLDHCTVAYSAFYEDDPKKTLDVLIDWHVKVALDPQVSSDAQALINKGAEAMREQVLRGLRSEDDSQQLRAIIASIVALPSTPTNEGEQ